MTDITPNHLHIYRDRRGKHITLDGQDILLDGEDPMLITGMENPAEVTRVMLTLLAPKITVDSEIEDREPEPATVDAPAPTIAEGLRDLARTLANLAINSGIEDLTSEELNHLISRAEQIEQERDQALSDLAEMTGFRDSLRTDLDHARAELNEACDELANSEYDRHNLHAEVERLTAERDAATVARKENVAADQQANTQGTLSGALPNPADVPEGQAWIVEYHGDDLPALRRLDHPGDWYLVRKNGTGGHVRSQDITLVSRLVPAPRTITTREELDALPEATAIRDADGMICERADLGLRGLQWLAAGIDEDYPVQNPTFPATVLWAPEETA